ncbi:MAG: hypothetical protein KBG15_22230, partial [Kofleriaceae bacterium]|nr:hypothetical protein [Kofleriaceae bacterium]
VGGVLAGQHRHHCRNSHDMKISKKTEINDQLARLCCATFNWQVAGIQPTARYARAFCLVHSVADPG